MTITAVAPRRDVGPLVTGRDTTCPAVLPGEPDIVWGPPDDAARRYVERAEFRCQCVGHRGM